MPNKATAKTKMLTTQPCLAVTYWYETQSGDFGMRMVRVSGIADLGTEDRITAVVAWITKNTLNEADPFTEITVVNSWPLIGAISSDEPELVPPSIPV